MPIISSTTIMLQQLGAILRRSIPFWISSMESNKQFGKGDTQWTDGELLFNSIVWATGTRMWGASKELTEVMPKPVKESGNVIWDTVDLLMPGVQLTVWSLKEGTLFLNHDNELDDLYQEGNVTK